jgi:diguanylate cyclase (GGDEF)-like protein/PAS domain S-box-containing protein
VVQLPVSQLLIVYGISLIIAFTAIEFAFTHFFKLRKQAAYPNVLVMELGEAQTVDAAARLALPVLNRLLGVRASFIALSGGDVDLGLLSVSGVSRTDAQRYLQAGASSIREAMRSQQPAPWERDGAKSAEVRLNGDERLLFIPVVALQQPIGVLAVVGREGNRDLKDGELLTSIGSALGFSLENLRQEEALRASEERFRTVFESAPIGMAILSPEGQFRETDRALREMLGFTDDELRSMTFADITHPDDVEKSEILYGEFVRGKRNKVRIEKRYCAKDGRILWCHTATSAVRNSNGEIQYFVAMMENITERKQAEEELQESEARFRTLVESTFEGIVISEGGTILEANESFATMFGYESAKVIGLSPLEMTTPESAELIMKNIQSGFEKPYEITGVKKDGTTFDIELIGRNCLYQGRNARVTAFRDITEIKRAEEALRKLSCAVEQSPSLVIIADSDGNIQYVNPKFTQVTGYTAEEAIGKTPRILKSGETSPEEYKRLWETITSGGEWRGELHNKKKNGELYWASVTIVPVKDAEGTITHLLGVQEDITERKRAEEALRESEEKYRDLVENMSEVLYALDKDGRITYVSPVVEQLGGYTPSELIGRSFTEFIHPDDLLALVESFQRTVSGNLEPSEFRIFTKSGEIRWVRTSSRPVFEGDRIIGLRAVMMDITERKQAEETIKHLAYHDALTNLANRTLFQDRLTVALAQARRKRRMAAVMFLDLDRFKVVNDTVGHALGDRLLQGVAERLTGLVREGDTVARVGGDEFTLLLAEVERAEDMVEVAERVLDTLRQPWVLNGHEFRITASIGIAMFPSDGEDADSLLRNADTAMYRAKDQGRDNYKLYTPKMNARIAERLALENSLRHGLERGEFLVYYQPQVDIASGNIVGMEALVRWQHPERGLVFPAEFIPVAEETGLIVPLGEWVLRSACAQNKAWQAAGFPPMRVAVNLSARQFQQRDLIEVVDEVLKETGLEARWLQLEITEGVAMQDVESNIAVLRELRQMGVQIAIDDFGTGHSSLSYLSRLPIDVVKIDQSFIQDLTTDPNDAAIARSIIVMAHNLKLRVIAEGVETEEQLAFLKKRRCDEMQGYLFSKPAPAEAFEEMLRQGGRTARARRPVEASR